MKTKGFKEFLIAKGVSEDVIDDIVGYVMAENGTDVNNAKAKATEEITALQEKIKELEEQKNQYADYEDLKKFKEDVVMKEEDSRKIEFLKAMKVKDAYRDIVKGQIDWSKATYDDKAKTYVGLEDQIKSSKEAYKDLYEFEGNQQSISFEGGGSSTGSPEQTANASMNAFIRGNKQ